MSLTSLDIVFAGTSLLSMVACILSLKFVAKQKLNTETVLPQATGNIDAGGNDRKPIKTHSSFIRSNQKGMLRWLIFYHTANFVSKYIEILLLEGKKFLPWDGENIHGWIQIPVLLGMNLSLVHGLGWLLLQWSNLAKARPEGFNVTSHPWLFRFLKLTFLSRANSALIFILVFLHVIYGMIFAGDGGRIYVWCCLTMTCNLGLSWFCLVPAIIDLVGILIKLRKSEVNKSSQIRGTISRLVLTTVFAAIVCPIIMYMLISTTIMKKADRLAIAFTRDQARQYYVQEAESRNIDFNGFYPASHITGGLLIFSLFGLVASLPFTFRRDFLIYYGLAKKQVLSKI